MWPYGVKKQQQATTTTTTTSEQAQEKRWRSFLRKDVCLAESKSFETCMETFPPTRDQEGRWRIANPCRPLAAEIPRCVGYYYCKPQIAYVEAECKINPGEGCDPAIQQLGDCLMEHGIPLWRLFNQKRWLATLAEVKE